MTPKSLQRGTSTCQSGHQRHQKIRPLATITTRPSVFLESGSSHPVADFCVPGPRIKTGKTISYAGYRKIKLICAGDIELNPGPEGPTRCNVCRVVISKANLSKAKICNQEGCAERTHKGPKCSGISRWSFGREWTCPAGIPSSSAKA